MANRFETLLEEPLAEPDRFASLTEKPPQDRFAGLVEKPDVREAREDFFEDYITGAKPIEEWLPTEYSEVAKNILDSFEDPDVERSKVTNAILLSEMFDVDLNTMLLMQPEVMKEMFGDELVDLSERFKKEPVEGGFFKKVAESWRRGDRAVLSDIAVYEAAFEGFGNEEDALETHSKIQLEEILTPIEGSFLADLVYSGVEVLPGMARGYWNAIPTAFAGMGIGAGIALAAGQVPPLTLAPEEIVTVPIGATVGLKAGLLTGAAMFWYKQGAGSMYASMREKGYDPDLSKHIAGVAAIPYAIVEFLQVAKLTPGLRQAALKTAQASMLRVVGRAAKRYGATWTEEVFEEVVQEIIQVVAEDLAGFFSDKLQLPEGISEFLLERGRRVWETTKEAGKAMALLPIPGAAIDIRTGAKSIISPEVKAEIQKKLKKPPVAPAEVVAEPTVEAVKPTPAVEPEEKPAAVAPEAEIMAPVKAVKPKITRKPLVAKEVTAEIEKAAVKPLPDIEEVIKLTPKSPKLKMVITDISKRVDIAFEQDDLDTVQEIVQLTWELPRTPEADALRRRVQILDGEMLARKRQAAPAAEVIAEEVIVAEPKLQVAIEEVLTIPSELQPLAEQARKEKTLTSFIDAVENKSETEARLIEAGFAKEKPLPDFYKKAAIEGRKIQEVKDKFREIEYEKGIQITKKLRQKIHAVSAVKGLTKKALSDLKLKHTGYRTLTGKVAVKKITTEQLESLLKAVRKARPTMVGNKKVITKKQENKIASLKENLIRLKHLTEADYNDILKREARGKEAKFIDAKNFITQKEANAVIRRIHNQAEITRVTEAGEVAIRSNTEVAQQVQYIDKTINDKRAVMKRDPWQFESMRYYNEQMELKTGAPFYSLYLDMTDTHLESTKTRTARLAQLANEVEGFKELSKDEEALQRVSLYISSQSRLKTPLPENITTEEKTMAKAIQKIFKEYEAKARWTRFYWWYTTGVDNEARQKGPYPIGDYEQNKKAIHKAVDIYESKGKDAVIEYLKTQEWGVIKSGYEPLENIVQKIRLYKLKPTTVGKSHIEMRTAVEYHKQDRNILQRLTAYMRQIDMLNDLSPKINAYIQLFEDNQTKFNNPGRVKESIENYMQTLKRYNIEGGFWGRITARLYSQAMRTVIMIKPVLAFRNLFQNLAFYHDKTNLIDPRNEPLTDKDVEYLETYVQQQRAMIEEYFMVGEKPLPGLKAISQLAEKVKVYPWSDVTNRRWGFWAKINQVRRSLKADTTAEMMAEAKFSDMSDFEQRMALSILVKDGKDAMARFVARTIVADIHFQYERVQRAPVEMGGGLARVYGNLMLFPRAYGEKLTRQANKMLRGKDFAEQWRAAKVLMATIGGGLIAGALYKKITGRRRNPYNPLVILSWRPGGLAQGAIDDVGNAFSNMVMAVGGDKRALAAFLNALPGMANMFIPFYDISLQGIEAVTDQKNIDYKFVRQMRAAIDNEYKIRGGAYKMKRDALKKWQYFIGGAGVDQKEKKGKVQKITAD